MADSSNMGFANFVPGFDFLQNLAKGTAQNMPQMPNLSSWVAPTLDVKELEKRIGELKAVHFWLDQNGKALAATIQALEVQKMTLATLQGMNVRMGEVAEAMKLRPQPAPSAQPKAKPAAAKSTKESRAGKSADAASGAAPVDPMQWWGALTEQFQQIAATAMQDVAKAAEGVQPAAAPTARKSAARKTQAKKK